MKVEYTQDQQKKHAKRKKSKKKLKPIFYVIISVFFVGVICVLMLTVFFNVKNFRVEGASIYTQDEIISATGIDIGDNLIRLSPNRAEENIENSLPYIKNAEVKCKFPSTIIISVTAAEEYLLIKNDEIQCIVDKDYKVLAVEGDISCDLPVVIGVDLTNAKSGKELKFKSKDIKKSLDTVLGIIESRNIDVTYIDVTDYLNVCFVIEDRVYVELGSIAHLDRKFDLMVESIAKEPLDVQMMLSLKSWSVDNPKCVRTYRDVTGLFK